MGPAMLPAWIVGAIAGASGGRRMILTCYGVTLQMHPEQRLVVALMVVKGRRARTGHGLSTPDPELVGLASHLSSSRGRKS